MKKNIVSLLSLALIYPTFVSAETLEEKVERLEKTVQSLTQSRSKYSKNFQLDIEDLEERLDSVETRSYTDKIQFGIGMRVERNSYSNTYADGSTFDANEVWRTKLNLNMRSKIADNLKFTGRLSMYKNWGDSTQRMVYHDDMQGRKPDSSELYVERAYVDWALNKDAKIPLILTLGRQPSTDGPSYHIKEDFKRKGTYDALVFDGAADGIVLTTKLHNYMDNTTFRLAYCKPNVRDNAARSTTQTQYSGWDDEGAYKDMKIIGLFIDKSFDLPYNNLFQLYTVDAKNINANVQYDTNTSTPNTDDINVGDVSVSGAMLELSKINSNIDLFFHYAQSKAKPNGKFITMNGQDLGLLSSGNDTSSKNGNAIWLGGKYSINKDYKIGAEYNKGSKNWFSFTTGSNDPLNKLATRGDATEIYFTKAINKFANLRIGHLKINYEYTGSGQHVGTPTKTTSSLGKTALKETTNTYITFNMLF
jgi:hypothetical protein